MNTTEIYYCAADVPTEVLQIIEKKLYILSTNILEARGFDDDGLYLCSRRVASLARGGVVTDSAVNVENAGKCKLRLCANGEYRDYRKEPDCTVHDCAHNW